MDGAKTEISLLHDLASGSFAAFEILYHQYKQAVYANIYKMIKQPAAAEDILQEVFLALWQNREKIHQDKSAGGWLFVVSYNKAATYLKQQLKSAIILDEYPENLPQEEQDDDELYNIQLSIVEDAINHLPARKKEVFRLCRLEGRPYEEVAEIVGISVPSVKDYLKQSTRFIKSYVQDEYTTARSLTSLSLLIIFLENY
ncbi:MULTISPECIES: RNA polymerase sigma factor [Chitinophaga]|uniref:RNA polymerase sigma factor n=1 Tax=Chitinophaga TaxID=79328 RepID=UPI002A7611EF|nr:MULTISPECIES: sigma-70 family RNA polymerase sigma factor [Chitinophaga]WPQ62187.1 sigma-70 family RNA polymerase sigma factor [Chitinophaga sancti]WPV66558.1 sigma-70 family RNA polymerase sigma factor [Chitinophaga sp. LS1]